INPDERLKVHFSKTEWLHLERWEKVRYKNIKRNYHAMVAIGLDCTLPAFMRRGRAWKEAPPNDSSDSEDEWTPRLDRRCPGDVSLINNLMMFKYFKHSSTTAKWAVMITMNSGHHFFPFLCPVLTDCEECRSFFIEKCEVHGPPHIIPDTPVPVGVTDRARQTLPSGLEIQKSSIHDAGLGVFNKGQTVPVGAHFGPYQGELIDKEEAMNSGYSWVIFKSKHCDEYIDAKRETHSNWMRYVNCARNDEEQNLVAFQYRGGILYRCYRPIKAGQELLVWYGDEYAKDLGITFDYIWNKKCSSSPALSVNFPIQLKFTSINMSGDVTMRSMSNC
uniref:SET domain-containing protein n=1 Tax=Electrophorus electricus TaxID=8005 RepID=A0A4W4E0M9_ELEEL